MSCISCACCCCCLLIFPLRHPPISLKLTSALSPLVVCVLVVRRLGWVLSGLSSCTCSGRRRWDHRENLEVLAWYQRPLGTPPPPTPIGLGSKGPLTSPMPTGRWPGGIYLKVTGDLEDKKCQGWTAIFSNDAVQICWPTSLRLELMRQEEHRSQPPPRTVPPQPWRGGRKYTHQFESTRDVRWIHHLQSW